MKRRDRGSIATRYPRVMTLKWVLLAVLVLSAVFAVPPALLAQGNVPLTTIADFPATDGADDLGPNALIFGSDGNLYGTTHGSFYSGNRGSVFRLTPAGVITTLAQFTGPNGVNPITLLEGKDGNFYGITRYGGPDHSTGPAYGFGTVFRVTRTGTLTTLWNFTGGADGAFPNGFIQGKDGNLYGTTELSNYDFLPPPSESTSSNGTVFRIDAAGTLTTVATLAGGNQTGIVGGLLQGNDGNFYGVTVLSGTAPSIFKLTPAGAVTTLATLDFFGPTLVDPISVGLIQASDGNFYCALSASEAGDGGFFRVTPVGVATKLVGFAIYLGDSPVGGLIQGSDGNFYFAGTDGGLYGGVYQRNPSGSEERLWHFDGNYGGGAPYGGLIQGTDGNFYGTTTKGGANNGGTVYVLTPALTITSPTTATAAVGQPFSYQITSTGAPTSYQVVGLPPGLSYDSATGLISGTPTKVYISDTEIDVRRSTTTSTTFLTINVIDPPTVTLTAPFPKVALGSGEAAEYMVSLSAFQYVDLRINYTIQGTAINGTDYVLLKGSKKIKAGKTSRPIKIFPRGDLEGAAKKTVKLTLAPGVAYTVGTDAPVKVKIFADK